MGSALLCLRKCGGSIGLDGNITPDVLQCIQGFLVRASTAGNCYRLRPWTALKQGDQYIQQRWKYLGVDNLQPEGNPSELDLLLRAATKHTG